MTKALFVYRKTNSLLKEISFNAFSFFELKKKVKIKTLRRQFSKE